MEFKKLSILLAMVLFISGQSAAVVAIYNPISEPSTVAATTLDVFFDWVGTSTSSNDRLTASNGVYDVVAGASGLATVQIKLNISGYAMRSDKYNVSGMNNDTYTYMAPTAGELMLIIDDSYSRLGDILTGKFGYTVTLQTGDHTITALWHTQEDDGTYVYDTASVQVRVRDSADDFGEVNQVKVPFTYSVSDVAEADHNVSIQTVIFDYGWFDYTHNNAINDTPVDVTLDAGSGVLDYNAQVNFTDISGITMSGTTNSTGMNDDSTAGNPSGAGAVSATPPHYFNGTVGRSFVMDATGIHPADSTTEITVRRGETDTGFTPLTFVGLLTVTDSGIFYYSSDFSWVTPDMEGINAIAPTNDANETDMEFSVDFNAGIDGQFIRGVVDPPAAVTKTTTTTEEGSFSSLFALLGLFSIGTIAYLIPRKYRN